MLLCVFRVCCRLNFELKHFSRGPGIQEIVLYWSTTVCESLTHMYMPVCCVYTHTHCTVYVEQHTYFYMPTLGITGYRIHKKFCCVFNFVFFADDKDPQNFFHK